MSEKKEPSGFQGHIELVNARRTREERKEAARKAGKASAKARKLRRTMREDAVLILSAIVKKPELLKAMEALGVKDESPTIQRAILAGQAISAIKGNTKAAEYLRDTCGEKPIDRLEQVGEMPILKLGLIPETELKDCPLPEKLTGDEANG